MQGHGNGPRHHPFVGAVFGAALALIALGLASLLRGLGPFGAWGLPGSLSSGETAVLRLALVVTALLAAWIALAEVRLAFAFARARATGPPARAALSPGPLSAPLPGSNGAAGPRPGRHQTFVREPIAQPWIRAEPDGLDAPPPADEPLTQLDEGDDALVRIKGGGPRDHVP